MKYTYIVAPVLIILVGMFFAGYLPNRESDSSALREQTESLVSLLPHEYDGTRGTMAEGSAPIAQNVPGTVRSVQPPPAPKPVAPAKEQPTVPALPQPKESATPVSYIIFYTGVPVRSAPTTTFVYTGVVPPAVQAPIVPVVPVVQANAVPIFVPRVVPSRVGPPKLVYTNGVVIKPRVYFPNQPVRNTIRGVTP